MENWFRRNWKFLAIIGTGVWLVMVDVSQSGEYGNTFQWVTSIGAVLFSLLFLRKEKK